MGPSLRLGLRSKITLLAAAVMLLVMTAMSVAGAFFVSREYGAALESRSLAIAKSLRVQLDRVLQFGLQLDALVGFEEQLQEAVKTYAGVEQAMVLGRDGVVLIHNDPARIGKALADPAVVEVVARGGESVVRGSAAMAGKVIAIVPVLTRGGEQAGVVIVAFPEAIIEDQVRALWSREAAVGLAFLVGGIAILLGALSFYVTRPIARLIDAVQLVHGRPLDEAAPVPVESADELGSLAANFNRMLSGLRETTVSKRHLEGRNAEISLLSEMNHVLLTALTVDEALRLLPRFGQRLFPDAAGVLYAFPASRKRLEAAARWGNPAPDAAIGADECWALRRAQVHTARDAAADLLCPHVERLWAGARGHVCAPLSVQGETTGLLHVAFREPASGDGIRLAGMLAEQISFALGNLRLREALREQSVRDPLTGLFNRRYLEETLERELERVRRKSLPLAVVLLDIDHFKRVNDTLGHDAGDAVLRAVAAQMQKHVRGSDVVCRYGGEEFLLLMPEASGEAARHRAEALRESVARMAMREPQLHELRVTVSAGVAWYPEHGASGAQVIARADEALYEAKRGGRNRVILPPVRASEASPDG